MRPLLSNINAPSCVPSTSLCTREHLTCSLLSWPGIFVSDILDAVPIDKYFELFKPSAGGEGGFIRLALDFAKDPAELPRARGASAR
jgi:hypothetical protein